MLGSNLVRLLITRGYDINVLVQPGRHVHTLEGLPVRKVEGDLLSMESLRKAAEGCETVIHAAAMTNIWPPRNPRVCKVNIEGTKNILHLVRTMSMQKLVYVGTANSFSFGSRESPGREGTPYIADKYGLDYMDSKYEAYAHVIEAASNGIPAIVVNPTFMIGPYDTAPSSGALILALYHGKIPFCAPGGRNFLCVKDAAVGVANALAHGVQGESYILGHENLTYREFFAKAADVIGVRAPKITLPAPIVTGYGKISSMISRINGRKPNVSLEMATISCDSHFFTSQKAVDELALPQTPIEDGISECFDWFKTNGYLRR